MQVFTQIKSLAIISVLITFGSVKIVVKTMKSRCILTFEKNRLEDYQSIFTLISKVFQGNN